MQFNPSGDVICVTDDKNGKHVYYCQKVVTVYRCDLQVYRTSNIPAGVQDALDAAIHESQNNTRVPNTDLLDDSLLNCDNNTDSNDAKSAPKDLGGLNDDADPTINPELE